MDHNTDSHAPSGENPVPPKGLTDESERIWRPIIGNIEGMMDI